MKFGLDDFDLGYITKIIKMFPEIEKAVIFGSRAMGNYNSGSDVDIAIYGEKITWDTLAALRAMLEEQGPLPYLFDILDYTHLKHQGLKEHIDKVGEVIWARE